MNLQKEKQKIEKAFRVIELIEKCNWQINQNNRYINNSIGYWHKDRITIMQGVKARLENYYKNLIK